MYTIKQLRQDMNFNFELGGLIEVLKGVALAQFRQLQSEREYFLRFNRAMDNFSKMVDILHSRHPFMLENPVLPKAIVMITSDEGFMGGLNQQVVEAGITQRAKGDNIIVLGERGANILEELKENFFYFPAISDPIQYSQAQGIKDYLVRRYLKKEFGKVLIVYPKFVSFVVQEIRVEQLLPYQAPLQYNSSITVKGEIIVEPSEGRIIDYLIQLWLAQKIYDLFWDSKLSETSSRVVHLEGSSQALTDLSKKLRLQYFHTLHLVSDKNIREVIASRLMK